MYSVPTNDDSPQVQSPHLSKERRQSQEQTEVEAGLPAPEESRKMSYSLQSHMFVDVI